MHDGTVNNQLLWYYGQSVFTRMIQFYGFSKLENYRKKWQGQGIQQEERQPPER